MKKMLLASVSLLLCSAVIMSGCSSVTYPGRDRGVLESGALDAAKTAGLIILWPLGLIYLAEKGREAAVPTTTATTSAPSQTWATIVTDNDNPNEALRTTVIPNPVVLGTLTVSTPGITSDVGDNGYSAVFAEVRKRYPDADALINIAEDRHVEGFLFRERTSRIVTATAVKYTR